MYPEYMLQMDLYKKIGKRYTDKNLIKFFPYLKCKSIGFLGYDDCFHRCTTRTCKFRGFLLLNIFDISFSITFLLLTNGLVQAFTFSNVIREASGSKSKLGGHV
jgi:hypothetical protein